MRIKLNTGIRHDDMAKHELLIKVTVGLQANYENLERLEELYSIMKRNNLEDDDIAKNIKDEIKRKEIEIELLNTLFSGEHCSKYIEGEYINPELGDTANSLEHEEDELEM